MNESDTTNNEAQATVLRRLTVRADKWEQYLEIWRQEVAIRQKYGFRILFAFQDTQENMFTWGYSHEGNIVSAEERFCKDPLWARLVEQVQHLVYANETVRPVEQLVMTDLTGEQGGDLLLRRYSLKPGEWDEFLPLWEAAMLIRRRYGFTVRLGLVDRQTDMFTWVLGHEGDIHTVSEQYYQDPEQNASMEKIQNYVADFKVTSVRQIAVLG